MSEGERDLREEVRAYVREIFPDLDLYTYYQLLEVEPAAPPEAIKTSFYEKASWLHPDRHHGQLDDRTHGQLVVLYARIAEGYRILSNPQRRVSYDRAMTHGKLRSTVIEKEIERDPELDLENPQARKFYKMAFDALKSGNKKSAEMYLGFALQSEPNSPMLKKMLEEAKKK